MRFFLAKSERERRVLGEIAHALHAELARYVVARFSDHGFSIYFTEQGALS
jgi:hypothetical protein